LAGVSAPETTSAADLTELSYARFGAWYDDYRASVLEPALEAGLDALRGALNDGLSDRDLSRIRNISGRVKSKRRTWRKIQQSQYADTITTPADIPGQIFDLVGLRITCTNLRDIETVQATLDSLSERQSRSVGLWVDMEAERDYVRSPKESGYRGWHVPVWTTIDRDGQQRPVTCELQVRTLLQDSWGELTHEDTYSKEGELPPLVEVLSKRIADLFATLDDIAEDLRSELDRIDEAALAEADDGAAMPDSLTSSGQAADAASMLLDRWQQIDRPVDLASLAWALQSEFGAEVSDDWFGYRSFKRFLTAAVPDGEISTGSQAYLLPPTYRAEIVSRGDGTTTSGADDDRTPLSPDGQRSRGATGADSGAESGAEVGSGMRSMAGAELPEAARELRAIDRAFPLLETEQWLSIYEGLAEAWRRIGTIEATPRVLNRMTRSARDRAEAAGLSISRRHLDYVAKAVVEPGRVSEPLDAEAIGGRFAALTVQRMVDFRILERRSDDILKWLGAQ
jgi:ppGpp synthetase/RelA/SpoT-type nucleotidyltranferase